MDKTASNRFENAVHQNGPQEESASEVFDACMALAKELAEKGSKGEPLTEAERKFMISFTKFMLVGLTSKI